MLAQGNTTSIFLALDVLVGNRLEMGGESAKGGRDLWGLQHTQACLIQGLRFPPSKYKTQGPCGELPCSQSSSLLLHLEEQPGRSQWHSSLGTGFPQGAGIPRSVTWSLLPGAVLQGSAVSAAA